MSVRLFVPSYNRPCQLYALLESIQLYDTRNLLNDIEVYYQGKTPELAAGYEIVKNEFKNVKFIPKSGNHYEDVLNSLEICDWWSITSDDSIFYRPFELNEKTIAKNFSSQVLNFSFRLGRNTEIIDYEDTSLRDKLSASDADDDLIKFYWPNHAGHYGHAFAIDSFLTKADLMKSMIIKSCSPSAFNYRYFECKMMEYLRMNPNRPYTLCFKNSVLVNSPNNMVTEGINVRNGVQYSFTIEELNQRLLDGEKIDLSSIDENSVNSVQQEIPYRFIKR